MSNKQDNNFYNSYVQKISTIPIDAPNSQNIELWYEKFNSIKTMYEERLMELGQRFKVICFNISSDEIINAMRNDKSTSEFAKERMAEIVTESMRDEKEQTINQLYDELSNTKTDLRAAQAKNAELMEHMKRYHSDSDDLKNQLKRIGDDLRYKESDVFKKNEENTHLEGKLNELTRLLKTRENELHTRDKEIAELSHRVAVSQDKNIDYETSLKGYKDEIDAVTYRNSDLKYTIDSLNERLVYADKDKKRIMNELESTRENLIITEQERDQFRDKLNEAANKFEQTFTKQEGVYETQYLDMKDKHKRMKQKLVEERTTFEREMATFKKEYKEVKESYESKLAKAKQDILDNNKEWENKVKEMKTEFNFEVQTMKNKFDSQLELKTQDLASEHFARSSQFEVREAELKSKLDNMQNLIKSDYVLKDRHEHLLQKSYDDAEQVWKKKMEEQKQIYENETKEALGDLQHKIDKDAEQHEAYVEELKKEMESKKFLHKEQVNEMDRMLSEEVEKRRKANESLSATTDAKNKLTNELETLKHKHEEVTKESAHYKSECDRLSSLLNDSETERNAQDAQIQDLSSNNNDKQGECIKLKDNLSRLEDDNSDLKFRLKDAELKLEELKTTNQEYYAKMQSLADSLEQEKNKFYEKSYSTQKEQMSLKDEFNERIEKEKMAHRDTVSKMHNLYLENKEIETKFNETQENNSVLKNNIALMQTDLALKIDQVEKLTKEVKDLKYSHKKDREESKNQLKTNKAKCVRYLVTAQKRVAQLKQEVLLVKKQLNYERVKSDLASAVKAVEHKSASIFKDMRYNHLSACRKLADKMSSEGATKVNQKTKYFENLLDNTVSDYESKLNTKEAFIYEQSEKIRTLELNNSNLNEDVNQYEKTLQQFKEREQELKADSKAMAEKIHLLREVNETGQANHEQNISKMKQQISEKFSERESALKSEFLSQLDKLSEAVTTKHKSLAEAHALLVDYAAELQQDLDIVSAESAKQTEYLQAHHNDYVRYSKEVYMQLKSEAEGVKSVLSETELKYKKELQRLEAKFMEVAQKSELELDHFNRFKRDKLGDLEQAQRAVRDARKDLQTRESVLEELAREKDEARARLKDYEERVEMELAKRDGVIRAKDREIHELHALLEKGYVSGIDGVRKSKNLDQQTQELQSMLSKMDKSISNNRTRAPREREL